MGWNKALFLLLNASVTPSPLVVPVAKFLAADIIYLAMALLVALWVWGRPEKRAALLATVLATIVGLGINQMLGMLWFEPRPFMLPLGHTLLVHAPDNSFPSDHGTFMWTIGLSLIATGAFRGWGTTVALAGIAVAWARIYLGVHFPIDMMAAALVAVAGAAAARALLSPVRHWVLPPVENLYQATLQLLRLPPGLFPRE